MIVSLFASVALGSNVIESPSLIVRLSIFSITGTLFIDSTTTSTFAVVDKSAKVIR